MTQYTIKPLEWNPGPYRYSIVSEVNDGHISITELKLGDEEKVIFSLSVKLTMLSKNLVFDLDSLEAAKARAQQIWNDYLKQYLEEVK